MIRYSISRSELRRRIAAQSPTWLDRAAQTTEQHRAAAAFSGDAPEWSEIKDVFIQLQHSKCAYCERPLEGLPYGRIEHDVEHFRPKSAVKAWPTAAIREARGLHYPFSTGEALDQGYYLLAHDPDNYATACKTCNSPLKSNYFPIAGERVDGAVGVDAYAGERAFLPFPLGARGVRPETVIEFVGVLAIPRKKSGFQRRVGQVTIDFFDLNRDTLRKSRALVVAGLYAALTSSDPDNMKLVEYYQSERAPHTSCARAYIALFRSEPHEAKRHAAEARNILHSL